jgi:Uma2 family endonuclease
VSRPMTVEEFLANDFSGDELRYELVDGVPVAEQPAPAAHARMVVLLGAALHERLPRQGAVYASGGVRREDDPYNCRFPDLTVSCTRSRGQWVEAPLIAVEILSPSDTKGGLDLKMPFYRSLPSIEEILLVRVDRRHVEHWRRKGDTWVLRDLTGSAQIALRLLTGPVPLDELYEPLEL